MTNIPNCHNCKNRTLYQRKKDAMTYECKLASIYVVSLDKPDECDYFKDEEREYFEGWASNGMLWPKAIERTGGVYHLMQTQNQWEAWRARAELDDDN